MQPWRVAFAAALVPQYESSAELMHFMTLRNQADTELYKEHLRLQLQTNTLMVHGQGSSSISGCGRTAEHP